MAIIDRHEEQTAVGSVHYCPSCGEQVENARYCPNCGHAIPLPTRPATDGTGVSPATAPASAAPERSGRTRIIVICVAALLGLAAIAVAAVVLANSNSSNTPSVGSGAGAVYRQKLTVALTPVVSANQTLSDALQALDGSKGSISAAKNAAANAQSAIVAAQGAVAVLTVPADQQALSQQTQQALASDSGYVQAVQSTLGAAGGTAASQLQTLATGTQTGFVPLNTLIPGASNSVSHTANLIGWANGASHRRPSAATTTTATTTATATATATTSASPYANARDCGNGITAGANTSCTFAVNVHDTWVASPSNALVVYSPVTNQSYVMSCGPNGLYITCTGGNNASVSWPR